MKRNWLVLAIILLIGFIVNSCGDDEKEPPICNLGAHLGIGETCNGNNCSLQNYNTSTGANAFPKPIYRVGKEGNNETTFTNTAIAIVSAYNGLDPMAKGDFNSKGLTEVHMHIGGKYYTWSGSGILEIQAGNNELIEDVIYDLGTPTGLLIAQLQPASNIIRFVKGKKQTEQLSVIADYIGNLKYATVVYIKL